MNWKEKLLRGSWRGVPFNIESSDPEIGRRVALHEYPQRDLPYAEDLGRKARRYSLEAFVLGADYMTARDALIAAIEEAGPGRLVHPYLGEMTVTIIEARGPRESSREGGLARFSLTFVESGEALYPKAATDTAAAVAVQASAAALAAQRDFASNFAVDGPEFVGVAAQSLLQRAATRLNAIRATFTAGPLAITAFVADVAAFTAGVEGLIRTPLDLAVSAYGLVQSLLLLPDRIDRAFSAYKAVDGLLADAPAVPRTTVSRIRSADNQAAVQTLIDRAAVIEAARLSAQASFVSYDDAARLRSELAGRLDTLMDTASDPVYAALNALRAAVVRDLATRAGDLARVVRYTPTVTLPALVLAHQIYGHAERASEIVERNHVRHPGFVPGGQALEVLTDV